ncbi:hypothetical protein ACEWY4_020775 [Coilia grayii]|uniref:Forkhead box protein N2 n=1 Tax=Coilia grayii TaxID=363190 RepID=A0ABD1J729_9TELE
MTLPAFGCRGNASSFLFMSRLVNGKGSLWCVDPEYRPNLIQALKKQHFPNAHAFCTPPASPPSASSPPRHLLLQGCSLKESDIDAATAMMLLNSAPGHHSDRCGPDSPLDLSRPDAVLVSSDPKQDHNYSSVPVQPCPSPTPSSSSSSSSSSSFSSLDEGRRAQQRRRAGSEGFHSDEDSDADVDPDPEPEPDQQQQRRGPSHGRPSHPPSASLSSSSSSSSRPPASKRARRDSRAELDEELKEAAGSLLHLAGIRTCLEASAKHAATAAAKHAESKHAESKHASNSKKLARK